MKALSLNEIGRPISNRDSTHICGDLICMTEAAAQGPKADGGMASGIHHKEKKRNLLRHR